MGEKIKWTVFIIVFSFFILNSQPNNSSELSTTIIGLTIEDYRTYLKIYPPLDRLYCKGNVCFFLTQKDEIKKINKSGIKIVSQKILSHPARHLDKLNADVNGRYHNYRETEELLFDLADRFPDMAEVFSIGQSIEGRELYVIKISDNVHNEENEPGVFIVGCHHAREWISVEVPLMFAQYLLEHYSDDPTAEQAVNGSQIYILPILNPDGLEFSIHRYRWWRKNRRYNGNFIWGVDLNRNYGYEWGYDDTGSSPDPISDVYRGPSSFSEPETEAVRQFLLTHPLSGALSYHNYSQLILYPWGYTYELSPDDAEMRKIAQEMSERIFQVNGRTYTYGPGASAIYPTNGDSDDWIYGTFGIPSFTIELPNDEYLSGGFFTSEEEIELSFSENLPAMLYFVNYFVNKENSSNRINDSPKWNSRIQNRKPKKR